VGEMSDILRAYWDISLNTECPHCTRWIDLTRTADFWEDCGFEPMEHRTHNTQNVKVWCPECNEMFMVDFEY
jgi:hypothetical protein